jgi:hypothetical protein
MEQGLTSKGGSQQAKACGRLAAHAFGQCLMVAPRRVAKADNKTQRSGCGEGASPLMHHHSFHHRADTGMRMGVPSAAQPMVEQGQAVRQHAAKAPQASAFRSRNVLTIFSGPRKSHAGLGSLPRQQRIGLGMRARPPILARAHARCKAVSGAEDRRRTKQAPAQWMGKAILAKHCLRIFQPISTIVCVHFLWCGQRLRSYTAIP